MDGGCGKGEVVGAVGGVRFGGVVGVHGCGGCLFANPQTTTTNRRIYKEIDNGNETRRKSPLDAFSHLNIDARRNSSHEKPRPPSRVCCFRLNRCIDDLLILRIL